LAADVRDAYDGLVGWEIVRPGDGVRHRLGHLPGTVATKAFGREFVPDDARGVAVAKIEQGTWQKPRWTVWRRVVRPRSVAYLAERFGPMYSDRTEIVADAAARAEAVAQEYVRQYRS
jgi:hypothetical protein